MAPVPKIPGREAGARGVLGAERAGKGRRAGAGHIWAGANSPRSSLRHWCRAPPPAARPAIHPRAASLPADRADPMGDAQLVRARLIFPLSRAVLIEASLPALPVSAAYTVARRRRKAPAIRPPSRRTEGRLAGFSSGSQAPAAGRAALTSAVAPARRGASSRSIVRPTLTQRQPVDGHPGPAALSTHLLRSQSPVIRADLPHVCGTPR